MEKDYLDKLRIIDTTELAQDLARNIRANGDTYNDGFLAFAVAYARYVSFYAGVDFSLKKAEDAFERIDLLLHEYLSRDWNVAIKLERQYTKDELLAFLLFNNDLFAESSIPHSVLSLATSLLEIDEGDDVLSLCSDGGDFFLEAQLKAKDFSYTEVSSSPARNVIAYIRAIIVGLEIELRNDDPLKYINEIKKANKIFANFTLQEKLPFDEYYADRLIRYFDIPGKSLSKLSCDWISAISVWRNLREDGKAVILMPKGALINKGAEPVRKQFVSRGLIETVITLPSKALPSIKTQACLVVLSHGNDKVTLMDASGIRSRAKRKANFSEENVKEILRQLKEGSEKITVKTISELTLNNFIVYPQRFLDRKFDIENGVPLKSVTKTIFRGAQISKSQLANLESEESTPYQYLTIANIQDGIATIGDSQYLTEIPRKMQKFIATDDTIFLSRTTTGGFKSGFNALCHREEVLITGNLFAIVCDREKMAPGYLLAFLMSKAGISQMQSLSSGSSLSVLSLNDLRNMLVPMIPLEEQEKIGYDFAEATLRVLGCRQKLEEALEAMLRVYDEKGGKND